MTVGILLITHRGIGDALVQVAEETFAAPLPLPIQCLPFPEHPNPTQVAQLASQTLRQLDTGTGVLVLSDIFGATPCNIAQRLSHLSHNIAVVAGLNLPMLVRVLNYPYLSLYELADKALSGGRDGVFVPRKPTGTWVGDHPRRAS